MSRRVPRPSAALVMGWTAGSIAAISFVPTALPLIWQIIRAEETLGQRHTAAAAYSVHAAVLNGRVLGPELLKQAGVEHLTVVPASGTERIFGAALPASSIDAVCATGEQSGVVVPTRRQAWAVSCVERNGLRVVTAVRLDPRGPVQRVLVFVLLLAVFVGIVTSLGILRLLRPISEITGAVQRVGAGERGVSVTLTGLAELDALVDQLNAAARSVDDREDAILSRIAVVQEMARMVAHEIRNPLQSLELLTSLVAAEEDPVERKAIGDSIHTEIRTLEQVVNRLLTESAARGALRLQLSLQSVAPLIEHVVALRRPQASRAGVRLTVGALSPTSLPFDLPLVKRSIENLVLNALQAVPPLTGEVRLSVVDEDDHVLIVVEDNGPGVPAGFEEQIFEPNVTLKEGGTGLGLALVKGVIDAHGGAIRCDLSTMGGARFEARIPFVSQESADSFAPTAAVRRRPG